MSTIIYINGVDKTTDIPFRSLRHTHETGYKAGNMSFRMEAISSFPSDGDFVELWDGSDLTFTGCIKSVSRMSPVPKMDAEIEVIDNFDLLMAKLARNTYLDKTLHEIIQDVLQTRVLPEELKMMLQFEDGSGTTVSDFCQFENHGTINGSGYTWDTSNFALDMDGTSGLYISVDDTGELDFNTAVSVCIEFSLDTLNITLLEKDGSGGDPPYKVEVDGSGNVVFTVSDSSSDVSITTSGGPISTGTVYTLVCTWDRGTGEGNIYIDGSLSKNGSLTSNYLRQTAGNLIIGTTSGSSIDGKLYRISLYSIALDSIATRKWHVDCLEVKAPQRLIASYDTSFDRKTYSYVYPADVLTDLARELGLWWWIDENCYIRMDNLSGNAPVATYDEDDGTMLKGADAETSINEVRNAIFVRGGVYYGDWRADILQQTDGVATVFPLPYKYTTFEMFSSAVSLAGDIQSWFKMEESSGNLSDAFSVNTLTASNLTYSQTGKIGNAIDFNGSTSSARKTSATHDTGNVAHSITAWVNADTHDATERIIAGFGDFSGGHSKLSIILSSGTYYLRHRLSASIANDVDVGTIVGGWHLVGVSYDPDTGSNGTVRLYLDGALVSTVTLSSAVSISAGVMEIGGNNGSNVFDGDIDEVTFFQYALSDQEHEAIYNMGNKGISAILLHSGIDFLNESGFDGYYNFNEKTYKFTAAPSSSITLYATGEPQIPVLALRSDGSSISTYGRRELEINDSSIESLTVARARAGAELARRKNPQTTIKFKSYTGSARRVGDTITITMPTFGISNGDYLIQKISTSARLATGSDMWVYSFECVSTIAKDWIDFLRDAFNEAKKGIDPVEGDAVEDLVDHTEEISLQDSHSIKTATDHTEEVSLQDAHTPATVTSGNYKWSNDAETTTDKLRWNVGDWG